MTAPLAYLHAFPLDSSMWDQVVERVAALGFTGGQIALDLPGFGPDPAPLPDGEPSLDALADAAVAAVRAQGHERAVWVGCSMGGYVALAIAERRPDAVAGLALVDSRATADAPAARERRLEMAAGMDLLAAADLPLPDPSAMAEPLVGMRGPRRERALDLVAGVIARQRPAAVAWAQRAMAARPDRTAVLTGLGVPAAVLWGELDEVTTGEDAAAMAAALGVPVTTLPGVGHLSPVEDAPAVAYALRGAFP